MKPAATIRRLTLPIPAALAPGVGANVRGFLPLSVAASAATNLHSRGLATARRPFRVLGLQQVAVGAESKNDMRKIWQVFLVLHTVTWTWMCLNARMRVSIKLGFVWWYRSLKAS